MVCISQLGATSANAYAILWVTNHPSTPKASRIFSHSEGGCSASPTGHRKTLVQASSHPHSPPWDLRGQSPLPYFRNMRNACVTQSDPRRESLQQEKTQPSCLSLHTHKGSRHDNTGMESPAGARSPGAYLVLTALTHFLSVGRSSGDLASPPGFHGREVARPWLQPNVGPARKDPPLGMALSQPLSPPACLGIHLQARLASLMDGVQAPLHGSPHTRVRVSAALRGDSWGRGRARACPRP